MKTINLTNTITNYDTRKFSGIISPYDFCIDYPRNAKSPSWADRIASDWKFDNQCRKNTENRDKRKEI